MPLKILRQAAHRAMAWKNGGGITYEVAVHPDNGASLDSFEWRLSMARVESDGPFSIFPGIDRSLAIMEGNGVNLAIENRPSVPVTLTSDPASFPGDVPVTAFLLNGTVLDLNIMTRRSAWSHHIELCGSDIDINDRDNSDTSILIVRNGTLTVTDQVLTYRDVAMLDRDTPALSFTSSTDIRFFRIRLWQL